MAPKSLTVQLGPANPSSKAVGGLLFRNEEGAGFVVYLGMRIDDRGYHANAWVSTWDDQPPFDARQLEDMCKSPDGVIGRDHCGDPVVIWIREGLISLFGWKQPFHGQMMAVVQIRTRCVYLGSTLRNRSRFTPNYGNNGFIMNIPIGLSAGYR